MTTDPRRYSAKLDADKKPVMGLHRYRVLACLK
jgi:hypothetical protein